MCTSTVLNRLTQGLLLGLVVAAFAASSAAAGAPTPRGLNAYGARWQGVAQAYESMRPGPTALGLKADGLRWQAIAQAYESMRPGPTALGLKADGLRWQGIARMYQENDLGQVGEIRSFSQANGFDWADYAIGIGSGMGLIIALAGALAIGWQRRHRTRLA